MTKKYEYLILDITNDPRAKVVKATRDRIHIRAIWKATSTSFFITESFDTLEVEWIVEFAFLDTHKYNW